MKLVMAAFTLMIGSVSFASGLPGKIECKSGQLGEDNYNGVTIAGDFLILNFHESEFVIHRGLTEDIGNSVIVSNANASVSAEGTSSTSKVDGVFVYDAATKTLNATAIIDRGLTAMTVAKMQCK